MGHYAKVINGLVVDVNVATQEWVDAQTPEWYVTWVATSYNVSGGVYYDNTTGLPAPNQPARLAEQDGRQRKNYAGIGFQYDAQRDVFIPPTPYPSWILNEQTCLWEAPVPRPNDNNMYLWNEVQQEWTPTGGTI